MYEHVYYFVFLSSLPPDISRLVPCVTPTVPLALPVVGGRLMKMNGVTQQGLSLPSRAPLLNLTLQAALRDHTG